MRFVSTTLMIKAVSRFLAMAFFMLCFQQSSFAQVAGELITDTSTFRYDGLTQGVTNSLSITFAGPNTGSGTNSPPTNLAIDCTVETDCAGGLIIENTAGQVLGDLVVTDPDAGDTFTFSVDDIRFEVVSGQLQLSDGEVVDFETEPEIVITILVTDQNGTGNEYTQTLTIVVRDANDAPVDVKLSNNYVPPLQAGAKIGVVSFTDVDVNDEHTIEVLNDDRFIIEGDVLRLADGVSLPEDTQVTVTIRVTDKAGLTSELEVIISSNPDDRQITPTQASIDFLAPDASGDEKEIPAAVCKPPAAFNTDIAATSLRNNLNPGNITGPQILDKVDAYAIGDPVIITVADPDQNLQPFFRDSVVVRVQVEGGGDTESILLTESDVNTGIFLGYVFTTSQISNPNDCILSVKSRDNIEAIYTDPRDNSDIKTTVAVISPVGIVFNDSTGEPINGLVLTLVDAVTGQPADVRGDGPVFAEYPSTVTSGETVTDASGQVYAFEAGEYRFPSIPDGDYRVEVFNARGWVISTKPDDELQSLGAGTSLQATSTGKFALNLASRGNVVHVSQGALPRVDIPLSPVPRENPPVNTPSEIQFLQYSSNASVGSPFNVGETRCVSDTMSQVSELKDVNVPVPGTVNLLPTTTFKAGQPIFVKVVDKDQNNDPAVRERITIQLDVAATGDREYLDLLETAADSGEFVGYVQSAENEAATGSCALGVQKNESITTTYRDAFDQTDTSDSLVLVDPFGKIFSTKDGKLLNGVKVSLVDTATGQLAEVFGDGPSFAKFPNPIISGSQVSDDANLVYNFPEGEYRFPFVKAGFYQLKLDDLPQNTTYPSSTSSTIIQSLPGAPFEVNTGSRGEEFEVPIGPALHIDLPIDEPIGEIFLSKRANKDIVSIGDFLRYEISIENKASRGVNGSKIKDVLPKGFRYQINSLRINGSKLGNPVIAGDGRTMLITLPEVAPGTVDVSYVVEVTPAAEIGVSVNTATVIGDEVVSSNITTAKVSVKNDLFRDKAILVGRVYEKSCPTPSDEEKEQKGIAGVRLYLEDGSYVITDENGNWHLEGVNPGTHIVQLDVDSLEERYEVSSCNANTRFAGSEHSQFVDVKGGTLWRADFAVQEKPAPESEIALKQTLKVDDEGVWVQLNVENNGPVAVSDVKAIYSVPRGWKLSPKTEKLNGEPTSHSASIVGSIWDLGSLEASADIRFRIEPKVKKPVVTDRKEASNNLMVTLNDRFKTRSAVLSIADKVELDRLASLWQGREWQEIRVLGHTDNVPIAKRNQREYANNQVLSGARALAVAKYLEGKLAVDEIKVLGAGSVYPIANNSSAIGRQQNRRVEILLKEKVAAAKPQVVDASALNGDSIARIAYKSVGSPRGMTSSNKVPLNRLVGGFDKLEIETKGVAVGSWDLVDGVDDKVQFVRAKDVQGIINIKDGDRMGRPVKAVRFDLDSRLKPKLVLDGVEVPKDRIGFTSEDPESGKTIYKYIGVNFGDPGTHKLEVFGLGPFGNARFSQSIDVIRVGDLFDVKVLDTSGNIADGRSPVTAKLGLYDDQGEPLNLEYKLLMESSELQRYNKHLNLKQLSEIEDSQYVDVSAAGIVKFNPVDHSGVFRAVLKTDKVERQIEIFVAPEKRDWIMVGLAEGSIAHTTLSGNMQAAKDAGIKDEFDQEGRIAFYAKGQVRGDYVLTLSYDTDKEKKSALEQSIDPTAFYTLYGDRTSTQYDAASREKLFLKLEKDQFYALFGDYTTGLSVTELSNYSRSMTGLKTEYVGDKFDVTAFAAETDQAFLKDEIRGDGTSGLYRLKSKDVITNSEKIKIETRDRFHSQDIVDSIALTRHLDYNIDYETGTIFFKQPIFSQDSAFNPVYIVVDYETEGNGRDELNVGGRVAYKGVENLEVGATYVKEGVAGRESELAGVDLKYQLNEGTEIRAEIAKTQSELDDVKSDGSAYLVEIEHRQDKVDGRAYVREQQGAFGLGQQNSAEKGTRKIGVDGSVQVTDAVEVKGEAYRETDLGSGLNEDVVATTLQYQGDGFGLNSGLRSAQSETESGKTQSNQLLLGGNYELLDGKARVSASADAPIGGKGEAANFPKRLRVGLDYKLSEKITLKAEQEFTWGDVQKGKKTRIGMTSDLWEGGQLVTNVEQSNEDNAQRLAAVAGLKQHWELNEQWSFDFGVDRSQTLKTKRAPPGLEVTTVFSSPNNDDFTSVTMGSNFTRDAWDWATRVEYRNSDTEDRVNFVSDVIHNLEDGKQLLAKLNYQQSDSADSESNQTEVQLGYSFRPVDSRWTLFNRLDLSQSINKSLNGEIETQKIVNNLNANYLWSDNTQIALQYGMKYVIDNFDEDEYKGFTDLYGVEVRHDWNSRWDVGLQGSMYNSWNSDVSDFSYGMSVGYNMAKNMWMSLGYNFSGFQDEDFSASEYTAKGVYLKYRMKFDQHTAKSIAGLMRSEP